MQDIFLTETAEMADVVLPAAAFAEKRGHFTNTERRVQRLEVALQSPGNARPDWQILQLLANAMGADWHYGDEQAIWQEVTALTPSYAGISWHRTTDNPAGLQWPCQMSNIRVPEYCTATALPMAKDDCSRSIIVYRLSCRTMTIP